MYDFHIVHCLSHSSPVFEPSLSLIHSGELRAELERSFGSLDNFRSQMTAKTVAVQGSGWGWLVSAGLWVGLAWVVGGLTNRGKPEQAPH